MFPPTGLPGPFPGMPRPPFGAPPFGVPPFGMPPPFGMMPPFGAPPFNPFASQLDETKYFYTEETKREIRECEEKLIKLREECAAFTEHETADGKKYYFNSKLNQSVWDKPKCLSELNDVQQKLEELKKRRVEKIPNQDFSKSIPFKEATNKESEMSEEEKAKQKSKPISSTPVPGTPWCVVWTRDKRVFFFNPSEKLSVWERPTALIGRIDVDQMLKEPATESQQNAQSATSQSTTESSSTNKKKSTEPVSTQEPPQKKTRGSDDEGSVSPKSNGSDSPRAMSPVEFLQKDKIEASKEAAIEAEHKAAQLRAQLPFEQRVQQFKEMLSEKEVSAYSTWEKELQKIVFDPRYLLLTSKERKNVFDKYVRERAEQESKEKAAVLKKKKEEFRELLKEANLSSSKSAPSFSEFSSRYARDERFKAIEKMKEREQLFNDYLNDLRKHDKEKKYEEKEKLKKDYISLLKEQKHLHRHSSWTETKRSIENDPRYKAIESSSKREDYFRDYCKYLDEKSSSSTNGHKKRDESEKMDIDEDEEVEKKRKEKEKQERIEASLRERNKEVKEKLSKYHDELEKEREHLRRDEAIDCFRALLIDIIKPNMAASTTSSNGHSTEHVSSKSGTDLSWKEAKKILKRDSRWSYCKSMDKEQKEKLFEEHMSKFKAKKREQFYQLLDETPGVMFKNMTWKEAKKLVKSDPRYEKLHQDESFKMEKEFENYQNEKYQKAKNDFKELLMQTKLITYKSFAMMNESGQHLKEIEEILSEAKSYKNLECVEEERKKMLLEYIEKLHNEGPPPPPTASEPSLARKK